MNEPVANTDFVLATKTRFDCRDVLVGYWADESDRKRVGALATQILWPENGANVVQIASARGTIPNLRDDA